MQEGGPSKEAASLSKTTLVTRGALSHLTVENGRLHSVESTRLESMNLSNAHSFLWMGRRPIANSEPFGYDSDGHFAIVSFES